jgi:hypothetical protein
MKMTGQHGQYLHAYRSRPFTYHYGGGDPRYANVFQGAKYQYGQGDPRYANVFKGERYQYGNGLGDILKGIGRFIFPWLISTASGFVNNVSQNLQSGKSLKNSAIGAAADTITSTADQAKSKLLSTMQGGGAGRKRRRGKKVAKRRKSHKAVGSVTRKRKVYKKSGKRRKRVKRSTSSSETNF